MTITISEAQASRIVDALVDRLDALNRSLNGWGERHGDDDPDGIRADLIEQHEQTDRLREILIGQLNRTPAPYWECADEGCAWINEEDSSLCEQCGKGRSA